MRKTHSCTTETNTQQPLQVSANSTDGLLPCFLKGDKINTVKGVSPWIMKRQENSYRRYEKKKS